MCCHQGEGLRQLSARAEKPTQQFVELDAYVEAFGSAPAAEDIVYEWMDGKEVAGVTCQVKFDSHPLYLSFLLLCMLMFC